VLTGRVSPSGRTPITWPRAVGQIPLFYGHRSGGRPENSADRYTSKYLDVANSPLFPFGYGLTYGRVSYANPRVAPAIVTSADIVDISVDVTNDGPRAVEETVFMFIRDPVASVARPLLELKGVTKLALEPDATATARFQLPVTDLRFFGIDLEPLLEAGEIEVLVGPCADPSQLLAAQLMIRA
jgi:beta-glucosidase